MRRRQLLPRLWLMTDERFEGSLPAAVARLPRGAGIVFRHHATPPAERRALFGEVRRIARARRILLIVAGADGHLTRHADGVHGGKAGRRGRPLLRSAAVHDRRELRDAGRADLLFVSPVHGTRSHPGARVLGRIGLLRLAREARVPVIALGGMDARRFRGLRRLGIHGWAGIDAWAPDQKRKVVPR